jgi:plasmid stabilization system protein ParE
MRLEIVEPALDEAATAIEHYRAINQVLGDDFVAELARSLALMQSMPLAWARTGSRLAGMRRRVMARFPYSLIYRVETDCVRVVAVMHQSQRPGYWRGRL